MIKRLSLWMCIAVCGLSTVWYSQGGLRLIKIATPSSVYLGDWVTNEVWLLNEGPGNVAAITVNDVLSPVGALRDISVDTNKGVRSVALTNATGAAWIIPNLDTNEFAKLILVGRANKVGTITNKVQGAGDKTNVMAMATVEVRAVADLAVTKGVDDGTPNLGAQVVYTLTVSNAGPSAASAAVLQDVLPAGVAYVSDNGGGAYNSGSGLWTVGALAQNATASLAITAQVTASGAISNAVTVSTLDQADLNAANDAAGAVINVPPSADLSLTKNASAGRVNMGTSFDYVVRVVNGGPDAATGVKVIDILPAGLDYVSDNGGGAYVPGTGVWTIGGLGNGGAATLSIRVRASRPGTVVNMAQVKESDQHDPDSTPLNGVAAEDDQDTASVEIGQTPFCDYDGDGLTDFAVYDQAKGKWYVLMSAAGYAQTTISHGFDNTEAVEGDYDGDGLQDYAIYSAEKGKWYILMSGAGYAQTTVTHGYEGAVAVPGDYDGDGLFDYAVYDAARGNFYVLMSSVGYAQSTISHGYGEAAAVAGDYDGDGRYDYVVYDAAKGKWHALLSNSGYALTTVNHGFPDSVGVPGDYDGDGKSDYTVYDDTTGRWYVLLSGSGHAMAIIQHGYAGAVAAPGNVDGDRRDDFIVYDGSKGEWYILESSKAYAMSLTQHGYEGAVPVSATVDTAIKWDGIVALPPSGDLDRTVPVYLEYGQNWVLEADFIGLSGGVWDRFLKGDSIDHLDLFPARASLMTLRLAHGHLWFMSANVGSGHFYPAWMNDHYGKTLPDEYQRGDHKMRIEYLITRGLCRFYWDGRLVGDWNIWLEDWQSPMTFLRVGNLSGGVLRYYMGNFKSLAD